MTLNDNDIERAIKNNKLIINFDSAGIAGACYELRMGSVYYDLTEDGQRFELEEGKQALIKPGHRVVLISAEELRVPSNLLVRIVSKGSLFSIGLNAVSTYADPGFVGHIGIVTQNVSDKYILLPQGEPIAKATFTKLSGDATRLYIGQHGYQTKIWPVKTHLQKKYSDVSSDDRVRSEKDEALSLLPTATRTAIEALEKQLFWTMSGAFILILLNALFLLLMTTKWIDQIWALSINLLTTLIVSLLTYLRNASGKKK